MEEQEELRTKPRIVPKNHPEDFERDKTFKIVYDATEMIKARAQAIKE